MKTVNITHKDAVHKTLLMRGLVFIIAVLGIFMMVGCESAPVLPVLCEIEGCKSEVYEDSKYCRAHTCLYTRCNQLVESADTPYCAYHRADVEYRKTICVIDKCDNPRASRLEGWLFCTEHRCTVALCPEFRINKYYCTKHRDEFENKSSNGGHSYSGGYYGDPYDVHNYDDGDDFADEWEDDFDSWDDAYDYWDDNY